MEDNYITIGLFGVNGLYNFGCEAIVRGACRFLKEVFNNPRIIYFTMNYEEDLNILSDLHIELKSVQKKNNYLYRIINKVYWMSFQETSILPYKVSDITDNIDMLILIGGDVYTIPAFRRKKHKYPYYNQLLDLGERACKQGKTVVSYGMSIGPFGEWNRAKNYYKHLLLSQKIILCREKVTIDYLNEIGVSNSMLFPDPAFLVKNFEAATFEKKYIGLNFSLLSLYEIYGNNNTQMVSSIARVVDSIYNETKIDIMLIPHVLANNNMDNDLVFMQEMIKYVSKKTKEHISFADTSNGFIGIKECIRKCYLVASARMHCAINSIVEGIPAIFLSYSEKSKGMCEYVYGNQEWFIDLRDIEIELLEKIKIMLLKRENEIELIENRKKLLYQSYETGLVEIKKLLNQQ